MSATLSESSSPDEAHAGARRKRIARLARMVFDLMGEKVRYHGGVNHEFDGIEDEDLIAALRACSFYTEQIGILNPEDPFIINIEGIDSNNYLIQFSLFGPGISLHASRVTVTNLSLREDPESQKEGPHFTIWEDYSHTKFDVQQEYSTRLKLGKVTADLAFLMGMSLVIGLMDDRDDDPDEDDRLAPLIACVMPTSEELREIRAKLPPSTINYDDEGDQPF